MRCLLPTASHYLADRPSVGWSRSFVRWRGWSTARPPSYVPPHWHACPYKSVQPWGWAHQAIARYQFAGSPIVCHGSHWRTSRTTSGACNPYCWWPGSRTTPLTPWGGSSAPADIHTNWCPPHDRPPDTGSDSPVVTHPAFATTPPIPTTSDDTREPPTLRRSERHTTILSHLDYELYH